jgi:hypothetical protein
MQSQDNAGSDSIREKITHTVAVIAISRACKKVTEGPHEGVKFSSLWYVIEM